MKYCFQAAATGSCFSLGEREKRTAMNAQSDQATREPMGYPVPNPPHHKGSCPHGCHRVGKAKAGLGSRSKGHPLGRLNSRAALL